MIVYVSLDQIEDNPYQTRQEYGEIEELAADIRRHYDDRPDTLGLQQIPSGRAILRAGVTYQILNEERLRALVFNGGDKYRVLPRSETTVVQLEFGHRRLRAMRYMQDAGIPGYTSGLMPVFIRPLTDDELLDGVWSENYARRSLSAVEEAELLQKKVTRAGNQAAVADAWGIARSTVSNKLRLLSLPAEVQAANRAGRLSERQAVALLEVARIGEMAGEDVDWREDPENVYLHSPWEPPPAPADFITLVVETCGSKAISSDDIREYAQRAKRHAGDELYDVEATFDAGDDAKVRQATCKGCPARMDQHCLDKVCHKRKRSLLASREMVAAADRLRIPWSVTPADFAPFSGYEGAKKMERLVQGGGCDHLVVGWDESTNTSMARPAKDGEAAYVTERVVYGQDPSLGVVYGHAGPLKTECLAAIQRGTYADAPTGKWSVDGELPPHVKRLPEPVKLQEWSKKVEALKKQRLAALINVIAGQLLTPYIEVLRLLAGADERGKLVEFCLAKGSRFGWQELDHVDKFHAAALRLFADAGIPAGLWPSFRPDEEAVIWLDRWYNSQRNMRWDFTERHKDCITALYRLTGLYDGMSDELVEAISVAIEDAAWWVRTYFPDRAPEAVVVEAEAVMA